MEPSRIRKMAKAPAKTAQAAVPKKQPPVEQKVSEHENKTITDLKKLYMETIKLDVDMQLEIYNLEKTFEAKHNAIFDQRTKMLEEFKKKSGDTSERDNICHFWLKVLKASYSEFISKKDEEVLKHLTDIRSKLYNDPIVKFVIEFYFEPNDFFSNRILSKTYYLNCLPDIDDPLAYDGAEIYKCEGCKIEWKNNDMEKEKKGRLLFSAFSSFFDFFDPPTLPENPEDPTYCDVNAILQNDFELGFYLKERVIPKAVMFFTGEIADCQSSDSGSDNTEEYDDEDEDDSSPNEGDDN